MTRDPYTIGGYVVGAALVLGVGACAMRVQDGPQSYTCRMAEVANELVFVETCPNTRAGDTLSYVLDVSSVSDHVANDWTQWCLDSGGALRADPATGDSYCLDVDF